MERIPRRATRCQEQPVVDFWCLPDAIGIWSQSAKSSMLHDRDAGQAARVRTIARTKLMHHSDKVNARRALDTRHQTTSRTDVLSGRHGCILVHDEGRGHSWRTSTSAMETWNMHGRGARQLLVCTPWECHQGFYRTTETSST